MHHRPAPHLTAVLDLEGPSARHVLLPVGPRVPDHPGNVVTRARVADPQALLLLLPSRLWASLEGGRVASLCLAEVRENYTNIEGWRVSVESFIYTLKQNNWWVARRFL
jgi:hypothetical protein